MNLLNVDNKIIGDITSEFNYQIQNFNLNQINDLATVISKKTYYKNNIYFTGIGKSENMAFHCGDLLKSVGINSFNLNAIKALHGDIGSISNEDIVIFFSNSGNTQELIPLIEHLNSKNIYTFGICCNKNSKFENLCKKTLVLPLKSELIINNISSIPTNSIMSQVIFINILITYIVNFRKYDVTDYKYNHPAGNIGKNLKCVKDYIIKEYPKLLIKDEYNLNEILIEMTKYSYGFCCFVDENNKLISIITDGDIRRIIINNNNNNNNVISKHNLNYNYYSINDYNILISSINKRYKYIPIINENKVIQGIVKL